MRRSSKAPLLLAALSLAPLPARAKRVYDPEIALLLLDVQKSSVDLIATEMLRQAEWLDLGAMRVLLPRRMDEFAQKVRAGLSVDSDALADYQRVITDMSPGDAPEVERLVAEIRRYHDLKAGPPLERVPLPPASAGGPELLEEPGVGADVAAGLKGTPAMDEPVAYAERRFGSTGPFLRRRKWNLDFYLGSFSDLVAHYRALGYRRVYRLRAPYISFGKSAYVLSPEPGLRPRLVYCGFYGQDLFLNTRAQWGVLTEEAKGQGPEVSTLTCADCAWSQPGVKAMRQLIATVPYPVDWVIVGYDGQFSALWKESLLGVYENDYWRLRCYRHDAGVVVTVESRHANFGEILAASLDPFVRRGARGIFYGGPAAAVDPRADLAGLARPTGFVTERGAEVALRNALALRRRQTLFAGLPSPLLATREWLDDARGHGVTAFSGEMERLAEAAGRWTRPDGAPVEVGIGAVLGGISSLHPEEDRTFYTVDYASRAGRESAKREFRDAVAAALNAAARDRSR